MSRIFPTDLPPEVLLRRALSELCVVVEEDYGWVRWLWFPVTAAEVLHQFWLGLETVPLYCHQVGRGGWVTITTQCVNLVDELSDYAMPPELEQQEDRLFDEAWEPLWRANATGYHDSFLSTPSGVLRHRGYRPGSLAAAKKSE